MSFFDPEQEDKLKEECGVFGIYNPDGSAAAPSIYYGLSALQHRGQEACGIAVCNIKWPERKYHLAQRHGACQRGIS